MTRAPVQRKEQKVLSRMAAVAIITGLSVAGLLIESTLGGGQGLLIGLILVVIAPSLVRAGGPRFHPLDPETFVPGMYFLSTGYAPTVHLLSSKDFTLSYIEVNALQVAYVGAVGCALICGMFSRVAKPPPERGEGLTERLLPKDWAVMVTALVGAGLVGSWIATTGIQALFTSSYVETYEYERGKGLLISGWYFVQFAIAHCVARAVDFRSAGQKVPKILKIALVLMIVTFFLTTVLGRRGPLLWMFTSIVLCLHVSGVRMPRRWFAMATVPVVFYAFAIEGYRTELGQGTEMGLDAARARLERIQNPFVIQELEGVFANLAVVVDERPNIVYYPGESWVNAFYALVPKPIWRDRPSGMSERFVMWANPSFGREGGGYAFNATAEGFVNMGLPGALLEVSMFTAFFYFLPLALCIGKLRDPAARALACCVASFAYNQFRGEFASMLKIAFSFLLAFLFTKVATTVIQHLRSQYGVRTVRDWKHQMLQQRGGSSPRGMT